MLECKACDLSSIYILFDVCDTLAPLPLEFSSCSLAKLIHLGVLKFFIR